MAGGSCRCRRSPVGVEVAPRPERGEVYGAEFPVKQGDPRKYVLVVSNNAVNAAIDPVCVRLTDEDRHRSLPTTVELTDEDRARVGLPSRTWALCHEVVTLLSELDPALMIRYLIAAPLLSIRVNPRAA